MPSMVNDHNVYVLGAGFSVDAGLPIMRSFLNRMRETLDWLPATRAAERQAIERVFEFRLEAAAAAYRTKLDAENIEELFSLASASDRSQAEHMPLAIAATLDYCRTTFHAPTRVLVTAPDAAVPTLGLADIVVPPLPNPATHGITAGYAAWEFSLHQAYVARMLGLMASPRVAAQNTFITFNYDLVLEDALKAMGRSVNYGIAPRRMTSAAPWVDNTSETRVLKLHGSVNWAFPGSRGRRLTAYDSYQDVLDIGKQPVLVPPTWRKEFVSQLDDVWNGALRALETATRIVVIGFSIPPTDVHFRYLMSAGLMRNISLRTVSFADPSIQALRERALSILRPELEEQQLVQFQQKVASEFLLSEQLMQWIGRPSGAGVHSGIQ